MKRYAIIALALVLSCGLFTGCRRGSVNMDPVSPTNQTATMPATTPATRPTSPMATEPATQDMTEGGTNDNATEGTENATDGAMSRSRGMGR